MSKIQKLIAHTLASSDLAKSENARRERADSTERVTLRSEFNAAAEALADGAYLETLPEELRKQWVIDAAHEALEDACGITENADFYFEEELADVVMRLRELKRLKAEDEKRQRNREQAFALFKECYSDVINNAPEYVDDNQSPGFVRTEMGVCGELIFNRQKGHVRVLTVYEDTAFIVTPNDGKPERFVLSTDEEREFQAAVADYVTEA